VANQPRSLEIGEELLGAPQTSAGKVNLMDLGSGEDAMLAQRGNDLDRRFGQSDGCAVAHASLQARGRSKAKRCEVSAEARSRCLASDEAIAVAPSAIGAVEPAKRCGASAEAIAMAPSARGARGEIESMINLMF